MSKEDDIVLKSIETTDFEMTCPVLRNILEVASFDTQSIIDRQLGVHETNGELADNRWRVGKLSPDQLKFDRISGLFIVQKY